MCETLDRRYRPIILPIINLFISYGKQLLRALSFVFKKSVDSWYTIVTFPVVVTKKIANPFLRASTLAAHRIKAVSLIVSVKIWDQTSILITILKPHMMILFKYLKVNLDDLVVLLKHFYHKYDIPNLTRSLMVQLIGILNYSLKYSKHLTQILVTQFKIYVRVLSGFFHQTLQTSILFGNRIQAEIVSIFHQFMKTTNNFK